VTFEAHIEILLDEALEATFPASDPVALGIAAEHWQADRQRPERREARALAGPCPR
jgi:hypothetical protein